MSPKAWRPTIVVFVVFVGFVTVWGGAIASPAWAADPLGQTPLINNKPQATERSADGPAEGATVGAALPGLDEFPEPQVDPTVLDIPSELLEREDQPIGSGHRRQARASRSLMASKTTGKNGWFGGLMSLAAVLSLVVILAYAARKWLPGARRIDRAGLEIMGRTALSPKQSIALVKMGQQLVMIGVTPDRISSLATVTDPAEVADLLAELRGAKTRGAEGRFGSLMDRATDEFQDADQQDPRFDGPGPARYRHTRSQVQGLLNKVKSLAASGAWSERAGKI